MKTTRVSFRIQGVSLPRALAEDIRGKQSVRATFRLSEKAIHTLSIVASHLGIKQKSLFDHLMDDIGVLKSIAEEITGVDRHTIESIQKTFVLSRRSLDYLESISSQYNVPRDLLVEFSIQRLLPIIEKERAQNIQRKSVAQKIDKFLNDGKKILTESISDLDENDPSIEMLISLLSSTEVTAKQLRSLIAKGDIIEELLSRSYPAK